MKINYEGYNYIVGYGIGQYYEKIKDEVKSRVKLDYLYDRKWGHSEEKVYDGIPLLSKEELLTLDNPLIIIMTEMGWIVKSIMSDLEETGFKVIEVNKVIEKQSRIDGRFLKAHYSEGQYEDSLGNKVYFDNSLSDEIVIFFKGKGNELRIERNITIGALNLSFGNNGFCSIGENTDIVVANIYISEGKVIIGQDCLLAAEICIRNHDSHHIFDAITHKRINYAKDITVGDQVWLAKRVTLLGGTEIGIGSIVGMNTVTSSKFGNHQIIAGAPARVIRENVCWSKDDTDWFDRSCLEECISKEALKYL